MCLKTIYHRSNPFLICWIRHWRYNDVPCWCNMKHNILILLLDSTSTLRRSPRFTFSFWYLVVAIDDNKCSWRSFVVLGPGSIHNSQNRQRNWCSGCCRCPKRSTISHLCCSKHVAWHQHTIRDFGFDNIAKLKTDATQQTSADNQALNI